MSIGKSSIERAAAVTKQSEKEKEAVVTQKPTPPSPEKKTTAPKSAKAPKKDNIREEKFKIINIGADMPTYLL